MAELTGKAVSELPAATTINDTDLLALSQNGASKKITPPVLLSGIESEISGLSGSLATYVRPNLLDNWYFVGGGSQLGSGIFPINQRGQTTYSDQGYFIDRWYNASANNASLQLLAAGLKVTNNSTSGAGTINQFFGRDMAGLAVTASMLFSDGSLLTGSGVWPVKGANNIILVARQNHKAGCMLENHAGVKSAFTITSNPNSNFTLVAVKLEIGSTQTLAHQVGSSWVLNEIPDYGEQLAKCKRYFERLSGAWTDYGSGFAISDTVAFIYLPIAKKAKTPTVTLTGTVYIVQPGRVGGAAVPSTVIETFEMNDGKGMLRINLKGTNLLTSSPAAFQIKDYTTYIDVSAE